MLPKRDDVLHAFLADIDSTLFFMSNEGVVQDMAKVLPTDLLQMCRIGILISHRCTGNMTVPLGECDDLSFYDHWLHQIDSSRSNPLDALTCRVAENLKKSYRHLDFMGVSTPDDLCDQALQLPEDQRFGFGYRKYLQSFEKKIIKANSSKARGEKYVIPEYKGESPKFAKIPSDDKNQQIMQIEKAIRKKYPEFKYLVLHFLDDKLAFCQAIIKLKAEIGIQLDPRTAVFSYHHYPKHGIYANENEPTEKVNEEGIKRKPLYCWAWLFGESWKEKLPVKNFLPPQEEGQDGGVKFQKSFGKES